MAQVQGGQGAKSAAKTIAKGGGPENPLADVKAAKSILKPKKAPKTGGVSLSKGNNVLLMEFLVCIGVLSTGTLVAPSGANAGVSRLITKSTGFCLLFFILALTSGAGQSAKKLSTGIGGLVTVSYLVLSPDGLSLFKWMYKFFTPQAIQAAGAGAASGGAAAASALGGQTASEDQKPGERESGPAAGTGETYTPVPINEGAGSGETYQTVPLGS